MYIPITYAKAIVADMKSKIKTKKNGRFKNKYSKRKNN